MCDKCNSPEHFEQPEVDEERSRLQRTGSALSVMAINGSDKLPMAEVAVLTGCGCGVCAPCRATFIGASLMKIGESVKNFVSRRKRQDAAVKPRGAYTGRVDAQLRSAEGPMPQILNLHEPIDRSLVDYKPSLE
jgi:hypothetical protein